MSKTYIPKEISWLSFNERVLQESENKEVPLIERFKFLGIYSNNLDEYFRVGLRLLKDFHIMEPDQKIFSAIIPRLP